MHSTVALVFIIANVGCLHAGPILIVPGLSASPLVAQVQKDRWKFDHCYNFGIKYIFWIGLADIELPCIPRLLTLKYNNGFYLNNTRVEVEAYKFGEADSVKYIDPTGLHILEYFDKFIEYFGNKLKYDVRAAPYDWRLAADELNRTGYYQKVQDLIEEMYYSNNNQKVTIVAHSMGGPVSLYFLNYVVTQEWKNQYIHAFIPLSGAWAGGNDALGISLSGLGALCPSIFKSFLCIGYEFLKIVSHSTSTANKLDDAVDSLESMLWMLPNPAVWRDEELVTVKDQHYTAYQLESLFSTFGKDQQYIERFQGIFNISNIFQPPNVPTYCFYGVNVSTPEKFHYDTGINELPRIEYGDGDGTVNRKGSEACLSWSDQAATFLSKTFHNVKHDEMVKNDNVFANIEVIVSDY